ncbi:helix-turn-helix transcriptional regulator [Conexibacter arvalis]|uniref:Transcriptional regulator with XRE-family HTH domain n=1 Tax=Conexibacter arvalis TaxID=912552 RepID=A0A840IIM4_9ACTN|nr:helix-turn-helix transcriptional regulator [Conexibacter arvalis]MBB4663800.1 transcriptional regulator with XRE-family HTH domain [Conexibacter arvalis]
MSPSTLVKEARLSAGLTQAQLAERLGTTQPVIARLERADANPTFETVAGVVAATGHRMELRAIPVGLATVDESLIRAQLALDPAERIRALDRQIATVSLLTRAGARSRGERS